MRGLAELRGLELGIVGMKRRLLILLFLIASTVTLSAQSIKNVNGLDAGILQMRENQFSNVNYTFDDYLQYTPAIPMLIMKACGVESRSSWGQMLVSDAFSIALMAAVTNGVKYTAQRPRPDGSANNSFPSGHSATAFMTATMLHMEYGDRLPWVSFAGYTTSSVIALSRLIRNKHYMTDVMAGSFIGIATTYLGYFLADLIFKKGTKGGYFTITQGLDAPRLSLETLFGYRVASDLSGSLMGFQGDYLVGKHTFVGGRLTVHSLTRGVDNNSSNYYSVLARGGQRYMFNKRFGAEYYAMAGTAISQYGDLSFDGVLGASLLLRTSDNFRLRAFAEYETFAKNHIDSRYVHSGLFGASAAFCF